MSTSASAMMEGDLLLDLFQTEFRKMHTDLVDKEVRLFHHLFHHLFATRLAKLEQFLLRHYEEFEVFEPDYAPLNPTQVAQSSHSSHSQRRNPQGTSNTINLPPSSPFIDIKEERHPEFDEMEEEEAVPFCTSAYENENDDMNKQDDQQNATDPDNNFISINDSDSETDYTSNNDELLTNYASKNSSRSSSNSFAFAISPHQNAKAGRKRTPIWECFDTTFAPNGKSKNKVISNNCRWCGQSVSAKSSRLKMHLLKCTEMKNSSHKISRETKLQLEQFRAQMHLEEERHNIYKQVISGKANVWSKSTGAVLLPPTTPPTTSQQRNPHASYLNPGTINSYQGRSTATSDPTASSSTGHHQFGQDALEISKIEDPPFHNYPNS